MKTQLPRVEDGIPIPTIRRDERNRPRSVWPEFLRNLEPGQSFVLAYPEVNTVITIARWLQIPLVKQDLPRMPHDMRRQVRIWRTD